jgi:hypothetical protein
MKVTHGILLFLVLFSVSDAQPSKSSLLFGSNQDMSKSTFCKIYKCQAKYDKQLNIITSYVLNLPNDNPKFYDAVGRMRLLYKYDERKQLVYVNFWLRENFKSNRTINSDESKVLADFLSYAVGKKLATTENYVGKFSPDVVECFASAREVPKENIEPLTRVMFTGEIMLQVDKKKVKYRAVCSRAFNGSNSKKYLPAFWLEIIPERG